MISLKPSQFRGSFPPLVTPFKSDEVDFGAFEQLIERQISGGSHGIVVTGTTGEPSTLSVPERIRLFETAVKVASRRIPVVAAAGGQSHAETIEMVAAAEKAGVDALLVVTPYFIRPPQRGLVEYYTDIGRRTGLPLLIYHIPGRAAVNVTVDTVTQIAERVPNLIGLKHAVNDLDFATDLLKSLGPEFRIFVGLEDLSFPMLAIGALGLMNAVGNIAPRQVADMCARVFSNDLEGARRLHFELYELNKAVFFDTNPIPMKYMMKRLGLLPRNEHRLPLVPATPELERRLDMVLRRVGLLQEDHAAA